MIDALKQHHPAYGGAPVKLAERARSDGQAPEDGGVGGFDEERVGQLAESGETGDPPWLKKQRNSALAALESAGLPTIKTERWKYTSIAKLKKVDFQLDADVPELDLTPHRIDAIEVVVVNGRVDWSRSRLDELDGVTITALSDSPAAEGLVGENVDAETDPADAFVHLNTAFLQDGLLVDIAPKTRVEKPIHLIIAGSAGEQPVAGQPRILVRLGRMAEATVIEHHVSNGPAFTNVVSEVIVEDGARLQHHLWEEHGADAWHIGRLQLVLHRDAFVKSLVVNLGRGWFRNDLNVVLAGMGAEAELDGLYLLGGSQLADHHTTIEHRVPHSTSRQTYKGVVGGRAKGVFNGRVHIHEGAVKADSDMNNRNLLLTKTAQVNTKPELEIYNDDVKAAHGTTVGQLERTAVFYLQTRGIPKREAEHILTRAFVAEVIDGIDGPLHDALESRVNARVDTILDHEEDA